MSLRKPLLVLSALFFTVLMLLPTISAVHAQDSNQQGGGSALYLSPTRTELVMQPGEQKVFSVFLKNITPNPLTIKVSLNDFNSDGISGTPQIIVDQTQPPTQNSLRSMLTDMNDLDLMPGETKEVKQTISMPVGASPGAYFGALRYTSIPRGSEVRNEQRQVALTASVAHLVFVDVPGDINQQIEITSAGVKRDKQGGTFFIRSPNTAVVAIKNMGNGFSRPFGRVTVNDSLGKEVYGYEINNTDPKGIILANSSRSFSDPIKNIRRPGRYSLIVSVAYGNGGEVVTHRSTFWYIPTWLLLIVVILVVVLAGLAYILYRKKVFRSYKKKRA